MVTRQQKHQRFLVLEVVIPPILLLTVTNLLVMVFVKTQKLVHTLRQQKLLVILSRAFSYHVLTRKFNISMRTP